MTGTEHNYPVESAEKSGISVDSRALRTSVLFAAFLLLGGPQVTWAQGGSSEQARGAAAAEPGPEMRVRRGRALDEVMVTARKRAETEFEVPESLTTFSSTDIEKTNINGLSDIGLLVPNLFLSARLDSFPNVTIRGVGGFGNTQGVGFYLDDVQLFYDASSRFGDLERIEVLKGPQGILYGGSNIGGAVKFVSARPDPSGFTGRAKFRGGQDSYFDGEVETNIPLSDDWALRIFAFAATDDSYLTNPNSVRANGLRNDNDPDIRSFEQYGGRISLAGDITERLSLFATIRYNNLDAPNNVWSLELDGNFVYPKTVDTSFNPRHMRETTAGTLNISYDFANVTLTSISSYTDSESRRETDLDLKQDFVLDLLRPEDFESFSQELRLSSSGSGSLQWQIGAYYLDLSRDLDSVLNIREGFCFLDPGFCAPLPSANDSMILAVVPFEVSRRKREQKAAFANFDYTFGNIEISGGVRVDRTTTKRDNLDSGLSGALSETVVLGRASLSWTSDDERSMVYGTFSQGFEPGDFSLTNLTGESALFGYNKERANQFEIGYKGRLLDNTLFLRFAAFYIDYNNRQFELQTVDDAGVVVEGIVNVGDSEQFGIEADFQWRVADDWTLSGSLGYIDSEWGKGTVSPVTGADISGQRPPNATTWSATGAIDFERPLPSSEITVFARLDGRYKGDTTTNSQFFDAPGDDFPPFDNPSFFIVDIRVGLKYRNMTFDVHIENLFDEAYYIDVQEFPNFAGSLVPGGPGQIIIGTLEQPFRVVASFAVEF